jgi:hypothetical protein
MENAKPVFGFLAGIVVASAFFLLGLDHQLGRYFHFSRVDGLALAIVPSRASGDCPASYAIDNRTDRSVFFTLADAPPDFARPRRDDDRWGDPSYDAGAGRDDAPAASYDTSDMTGLGSDRVPESAEPGIKATEDAYSADSNYGGSLAEYGADGPHHDDEDSDIARTDENAYGGAYDHAGREQARDAYSGDGGDIPPPPPGQPIPLTPPENSSPYGAPVGGSGDAGYGPQADRVRPGEIFFASATGAEGPYGPRRGCNGADNTVTVQLSN